MPGVPAPALHGATGSCVMAKYLIDGVVDASCRLEGSRNDPVPDPRTEGADACHRPQERREAKRNIHPGLRQGRWSGTNSRVAPGSSREAMAAVGPSLITRSNTTITIGSRPRRQSPLDAGRAVPVSCDVVAICW
jgi:hypothetical protein